MTKIDERKRAAEYETDIPRCGNCTRLVRRGYRTPRGKTVKVCGLHSWHVQENSLCKHWLSSTDEVLV
jgi:hypothetical protein